MGNRLEGKVAVVTGGGRGIGRGVALLLAEEGASVVVNDLGCDVDGGGSSHAPADGVVQEIKALGGKAVANYDDVALMDGGESVVQAAVDNYGQIDILVTCAGILRQGMIYQTTPADFDLVMKYNAKATFTVTKFATILMRQQRSGRIVHMTSDAGLGDIGMSSYAAASEAILGLSRSTSLAMGKYGVTCNAISPMVETRQFPGTVDEYRVAAGAEPTRDQRAGIGPSPEFSRWEGPGHPDDPDNVAPLVVYLCTSAAPNINAYCFGVRRGGIFLYANPDVDRSIQKTGKFTMDELDVLVPQLIGPGLSSA
ncbi:MAG: SDR family NAD(P)-dependent oxidoreductase [Chloroflexi bacterium]|jgi:NAD(P)-dependent dehydrogenase (short-subunit alcohol dehydrogenase family)|nr:SDR family NAD(P)-dependent oxidoreductase [Chloroflexota bacterium]